MSKILVFLIQLVFLFVAVSWAINNSYPVSLKINDLIFSVSSSTILIIFLLLVFIIIFIQRIIFTIKQKFYKIKINRQNNKISKGYDAFLQGMIALANKDFKRASKENKNVTKYLNENPLNLLLKSETLKIEKKYEELAEVYEMMMKNEDLKTLGLRGLMEHNLRSQDFHHAFVYGEKLFSYSPFIDQLYETLVNIISKTNNWQKLIILSEKALKIKVINDETLSINKSIALYEISKIKQHSSLHDSITLMEQALKLREDFAPFVLYYMNLLIDNNQLAKAKKYIAKTWSKNPNLYFKSAILDLAKKMNISLLKLVETITQSNQNIFESKILLAEAFIESKNWEKARNTLNSLLEHKPIQKVCLLMSEIEKGESNDPQKINAWVTRSNFGELDNIWICRISGISQNQWTSISKSGYFNSLEWKKPDRSSGLLNRDFESKIIEYINN